MSKSRIIYDSKKLTLKKRLQKSLKYTGLIFFISSLIILLPKRTPAADPLPNPPQVSQNNLPAIEVIKEANDLGVDSFFSIVIPEIGAKANISANIDPFNENEYTKALKQGVAHAKGTHYFLFAHSTNSITNITRYNAVFYSLKDLEEGSKIILFRKYQKHLYQVTQKLIVDPNDTSWLEPKDPQTLILQTCFPPGTNRQRLLIIAKLIDN